MSFFEALSLVLIVLKATGYTSITWKAALVPVGLYYLVIITGALGKNGKDD